MASTIHLQAAEETKSHVKKFNYQPIFGIMTQNKLIFFVSVWYILKKLFTSTLINSNSPFTSEKLAGINQSKSPFVPYFFPVLVYSTTTIHLSVGG